MSEVLESDGATAGGLLREARQASGMHIAALAVALKVPVSKLEALEADNYEALPDTVFVRALASSMCRTLKLDPAPILSLLPQSKSPRLATDSAGLNAPVKGSIGKSSSSSASFSSGSTSRSVTVVVLALLVGALVLVFFPRPQDGATSPSAASAPAKPAVNVVEQQAIPPVMGASGAVSAVAERVPESPQSPAVGRPELTRPAAVAPVANDVASAPVVAASAATPPAGALVLRARSESWVQVRDSAGAVALQRNLAAGESVSVAGQMPFAVVIGRADATEVFVRGKPFDLTTVSRENVARFEVK
ncbi:helix-turn-helix domain-containing protein [Acidovorax radicis]|uniref:helix-turn-helix domain-containing protein n=1 Tax=Acidovorax radicis TaxID=758826 RepID=UPI000494FA9C|nr:helix-turn-helix domain-containing protein [Acidovorax radicis]